MKMTLLTIFLPSIVGEFRYNNDFGESLRPSSIYKFLGLICNIKS